MVRDYFDRVRLSISTKNMETFVMPPATKSIDTTGVENDASLHLPL
jgi:hypothetical protein